MEFNIEGYVASLGLKKSRGEQLVNYLKEQDKKCEEKEKRVRELEEALRNLRHGLFTDINSVNEYIDKVLK